MVMEQSRKLRGMDLSHEERYRYEQRLIDGRKSGRKYRPPADNVKNVRMNVLNDAHFNQNDKTASLAEKIQKLLNISTPFEELKQVVREHDPSDLAPNSFYDYFGIAQKYVKSKRIRFVDEDFRYGLECVATKEEVRDQLHKVWLYVKWVGLSRCFSSLPEWINPVDNIDPRDIHQGELGNCYFLATLSSMARIPTRIWKLFIKGCRESKEYDEQGPWGIWLCIGGIWRQVIVDEYLPFNGQNELKPYFCKPPGTKVWPMLVEKCWAKVSYSFADSVEGTCMEAMHCLTGAPCFSYKLRTQEPEVLVGLIQEACNMKFITTASSLKNDEVSFYGITPGHAYSVFEAKFVYKNPETQGLELISTKKEGVTEAIIKLRNPWASTNKWNGQYSRTDPGLSPADKRELYGTPDVETGELWISVTDFKRFFGDLEICKYQDEYVYTSFPMRRIEPCLTKVGNSDRLRDLPIIYEVTINTPGLYYFGANQMAMRAFPPNIRHHYNIVRASLLLYRHDETHLTYLQGMASNLLHTFISHQLNPGKYYVALAAQFKSNFNFITLSCYGPSDISIKVAHNFKSFETIRVLEYLFLEFARTQSTKDPKLLQATNSHPEFKSMHMIREDGYGFFYFKNMSKTTTYKAVCKLSEFVNLQFISANSGEESFTVVLGPGQETLILYIQRDTPNRIKFQVFVEPTNPGGSSSLPPMHPGFGKGMHLAENQYQQAYNQYQTPYGGQEKKYDPYNQELQNAHWPPGYPIGPDSRDYNRGRSAPEPDMDRYRGGPSNQGVPGNYAGPPRSSHQQQPAPPSVPLKKLTLEELQQKGFIMRPQP